MNCQRFEEVVSEVARGQMMDAELRSAALAHSDDCVSCTARLRDEQSLTRGLRALSAQMQTLGPRPDLESQLRSAMRQNVSATPVTRRSMTRRYWLAVAAAALLFVASAIAINWQGQSKHGGEKTIAVKSEEKPQPNSVEKDDKTAVPSVSQPPKEHIAFKPHRRPRAARQMEAKAGNEVVANHAREIATDFIPLGYMNSASLQDGGHIVRVELPRSALVSFGLPVNMDRLNEKVKADVWLGVDGLAHAIRFVQ